jgi:hypothetical protein
MGQEGKRSIGREAAIALYDSQWWVGKSAREIAVFQMHTNELCMPFGDFQRAMQEALGRPVWTHEFGSSGRLLDELMGNKPAPSFAEIMALIPAEKLVVVATGEQQ